MNTLTIILASLLVQEAPTVNIEIRSAMVLGAKSAAIQRKLPVLNQVVLVPDEATYLDEISNWTPMKRWPVLFDKEPFASRFIRRFAPQKIWRRDSVGRVDDIKVSMQKTVAKAWGGTTAVGVALKNLNLPPLGVVITSPNDSSRTAAVALAAGRGQLLKYMPIDWGQVNKILSEQKTNALIDGVANTLSETGLSFNKIGDEIDAITFCMKMPSRVNFANARENPVAVSDVIGRDKTGERFAWTGWIFGTKAEASYLAMCSLFLERDKYWFCSTYPTSGGWAIYGLNNILEILPQYQIDATSIGGTIDSLKLAATGGVSTDVAYFMTKGNQDFLEMSDGRTSPTWLPILDTPTALYFLHSWSLKNPESKSTVGGTWLSRGVYAYVGSSHEPMLQSFVPPIEVLRRTMSLIPFLPASRWSTGEHLYSKPWRLNTIGDPLMLCPPKGTVKRKILSPEQNEYYLDVIENTRNKMRIANDKPTDETFADAISSAVLIGKDDVAVSLWDICIAKSCAGPISSKAALPPLFRQKQPDYFLWAFNLVEKPTRLEKDMLWQLLGSNQTTPLQLLIDNLRGPYQLDDFTIIADRVAKQRGLAAVRLIIDNLLENAIGRNQRGLKKLRKEYDG
ncbi:MAG: hypothetical protein QF718_02375 [Phycisphaerales bacterium]|jgi:hypothetical protein|nr:hypothetical protein [Phycisphaerales bacterium]